MCIRDSACTALHSAVSLIDNASQRGGMPNARLLAGSKTRPASAIAAMAGWGQQAYGENYVQEARHKIEKLRGLGPVSYTHLDV